jgi:hypothetical protein
MHVMIRLYQALYDITGRAEKHRRSLFSRPLMMSPFMNSSSLFNDDLTMPGAENPVTMLSFRVSSLH